MFIKKIKYYIIFATVFFSWFNFVSAGLEITEVMYNPEVKTDHLWIKVFNNNSENVDLTEWYVVDYDGTSWHYHRIKADSSTLLNSNSYAIIAKSSLSKIEAFKSKNPEISGQLFYGNLTIKNEGIIGLSQDRKEIIGETSYGGDIKLINTNVIDNSSTGDTVISQPTNTKSPENLFPRKVTAKIISPKIIFAGMPFVLNSLITTNKNEIFAVGRFKWNFGDGTTREDNHSNKFEHTYFYPGDYVVSLDYLKMTSFDPDDSDRITLRVVSPEILISSVGSNTDAFIEIENKSNYEITLSNWVITAGSHYFIIPKGTIVLAKKKLKISPKVTGFISNDLKFIKITNSKGELITIYPTQKVIVKSQKRIVASKNIHNNLPLIKKIKTKEKEPIIDLNKLSASAGNSGSVIFSDVYPYFGLAVIIILGILSIFLIRKKDKPYDDLEQGMRAEDIKIIE